MKTEGSRSTVARAPDGAAKSTAAPKAAEGGRKAAAASRRARELTIKGIPVSPGVIIGAVFDTSEVPPEAPRRRSRRGRWMVSASAWPPPSPPAASRSPS
ncbi:hypothetical protein ACFQU7_19850 [Pseudoroseomonas wenyumeiae]